MDEFNHVWLKFDPDDTREVALHRTVRTIKPFIPRAHFVSLATAIREMVKNIFDHAGGRGTLLMEEEGGHLIFTINDEGVEKYDFATLRENDSSKRGNGTNMGKGLGIIHEIGKRPDITLEIDTSAGFCYKLSVPIGEDRHISLDTP